MTCLHLRFSDYIVAKCDQITGNKQKTTLWNYVNKKVLDTNCKYSWIWGYVAYYEVEISGFNCNRKFQKVP